VLENVVPGNSLCTICIIVPISRSAIPPKCGWPGGRGRRWHPVPFVTTIISNRGVIDPHLALTHRKCPDGESLPHEVRRLSVWRPVWLVGVAHRDRWG
jgi:hypothetical protein